MALIDILTLVHCAYHIKLIMAGVIYAINVRKMCRQILKLTFAYVYTHTQNKS